MYALNVNISECYKLLLREEEFRADDFIKNDVAFGMEARTLSSTRMDQLE